MQVLIAETILGTPHIETAMEIGLDHAERGDSVQFYFPGLDLPYVEQCPQWLARMLGSSLQIEVAEIRECIKGRCQFPDLPPDLPSHRKTAEEFAQAAPTTLAQLKEYRLGHAALGLGVASTLISNAGNSLLDIRPLSALVRRMLYSAAMIYLRMDRIISSARPDIVYTFNGRLATARPIVEACTEARVEYSLHERGPSLATYDLYGKSVHNFELARQRIQAHWAAAQSPEREQIAEKYYLNRRHPHAPSPSPRGEGRLDDVRLQRWRRHQEIGHVPPRRPGVARVVYFSSSDDEFAAISDGVEATGWPSQMAAAQELVGDIVARKDFELLVRVHPNMMFKSTVERRRWAALTGPNVFNFPPASRVDSYALTESADVVVSYGSTVGIEAVYWGRPSILLGDSRYRGCGVCFEPTTARELHDLLDQARTLPAKPRESTYPYGYYAATFGIPYRRYRAESFHRGSIEGHRLSPDSPLVKRLRRWRFNRITQQARRLMWHLRDRQAAS